MDTGRFRQLVDLVGDALELPAGEREALLLARCGTDAPLLVEARELVALAEHTSVAHVTGVLQDRVAAAAATLPPRAHPEAIGPYRLVRVLGEGGMGVVYGARQEAPLRRDVAIKVVRGALAAPAILSRFEGERQTLARLEHPHVARILDAGATADGLPYFVMEWVRGEPITAWCAARALDLEERLALFAKVCLAVHHAHQKAIVHRDLKPGNVLVAEVDGVAEPKVIDFGIARVLAVGEGSDTAHTAQGTLLGTLEYMSPEQASWAGGEADVRSDVYSLGVMLYELLTGTLPFPSEALRRASPVEVQRLLQDTDPPTPSERLAARPDGAVVLAPPGARAPMRLAREVDWVVMKAMEKDPARRYQSAHALADDLARLRRHEPVSAAPPGMGYRATKFVRRHRAGTMAAAGIAVALVGGAAAAIAGFVRAERARDVAVIEARKAEAVSAFLTGMFAEVEPDRARGNVVTVRDVLDSAAARLDRDSSVRGEPEVEATIRFAIGNSYRELGEYRAAIPMLERTLEIWRTTLGPDDDRLADALHGIGNSHWRMGNIEASLPYAEEVLEFRRRTVGRMTKEYSEAVHVLANSQADLGHYALADSLYREALSLDSALLRGEDRVRLGTSLNNFGTILVDEGKFEEAVGVFAQALAIRREFLAPNAPGIATVLGNMGHALLLAERVNESIDTLARAAEMAERVFGPGHVQTASVWRHQGEAYLRAGRLEEATRQLLLAHDVYVKAQGPTSHRVGQVILRLGEVRIAGGDRAGGMTEMERGWKLVAERLGMAHPITRSATERVAVQYEAAGQPALAAQWRARVAP